jgi:hypothetical protein
MYKKRIAEWGLRKYSGRGKARTSSNESRSHRPILGDQQSPSRRHHRSSQAVVAAESRNQYPLSSSRGTIERDLDTFLRSKEQNLSYARFRAISEDLAHFERILTQIDNYYSSYSQSDWTRQFPKIARASIKEIPLCLAMQIVTRTACHCHGAASWRGFQPNSHGR